MQANRHIVQLVNIPDNPLEDPLLNEDVDPDSWIIMEWLNHGTIGEFLMTAMAYLNSRGQKLPNRLLWRFFLCLIRGAIAMAVSNPFLPYKARQLHLRRHMISIANFDTFSSGRINART